MAEEGNWRARAFEHAMAIWVEPEVRRRQQRGAVPGPFVVNAAQIVFYPDGRQLVRLNEEIQGTAKFDPQPGFAAAEEKQIRVCDIKGLSHIELIGEEANCGHFTLIRLVSGWCGSFDFRYNKSKTSDLLSAAEEFLNAARDSILAHRKRAAVDTLFSAAELAAKAFIVAAPGNNVDPQSHGHIHSRFNLFSRHGDTAEYCETFNALSAARGRSRYLRGAVTETTNTLTAWAMHVSDLIADVRARIASRD